MKVRIDAADTVFSQYVRLRDKQCTRCYSPVTFNAKGLPVSHQASHFMGRGKESTRFDPENCDTLCGGCHMYLTANPAEHYMWQVNRKGQKAVDLLVLRSNQYKRKDRKMELIIWREALKQLKDSQL